MPPPSSRRQLRSSRSSCAGICWGSTSRPGSSMIGADVLEASGAWRHESGEASARARPLLRRPRPGVARRAPAAHPGGDEAAHPGCARGLRRRGLSSRRRIAYAWTAAGGRSRKEAPGREPFRARADQRLGTRLHLRAGTGVQPRRPHPPHRRPAVDTALPASRRSDHLLRGHGIRARCRSAPAQTSSNDSGVPSATASASPSCCVCRQSQATFAELADEVGLARSTTHHHLAQLRAADLIALRGNARGYHYTLDRDGFAAAELLLEHSGPSVIRTRRSRAASAGARAARAGARARRAPHASRARARGREGRRSRAAGRRSSRRRRAAALASSSSELAEREGELLSGAAMRRGLIAAAGGGLASRIGQRRPSSRARRSVAVGFAATPTPSLWSTSGIRSGVGCGRRRAPRPPQQAADRPGVAEGAVVAAPRVLRLALLQHRRRAARR